MTDSREGSRWDGWLSPRQWIPLAGLLGVSLVGMGVVLALRWDSDAGSATVVCAPGDVNCLRPPVHYHADFGLFIDGTRFDFNDPDFLSTEDEPKNENAHSHAPRANVAHVHRARTTWFEFFRSLGFSLNDPSTPGTTAATTTLQLPDGRKLVVEGAKTFKFYVNGVKVDGVTNLEITDLQRVLISYGDESEDEVRAQLVQVGDEACIVSGRCLERGQPENEPCGGAGVCTN